jgi:hypothetical protein
MECKFKQSKGYSTSQVFGDVPPKKVLKHDIDGFYFNNFKNTMDNLSFELISINFDDRELPNRIESFIETHKEINRFNIKSINKILEDSHKVVKTENSKKWQGFLKRWGKQFHG